MRTNSSNAKSVTIIGGGYAGMSAAALLASQGIQVTVLESAKQLGGRARGVYLHDTRLDNGQHIMLGCYRHTLDMIRLVGGNIKQDFVRLPLQLTLHRRFQLKAPVLPAPFHLLAGFIRAKGLSWKSRWNAARFMIVMRLKRFRILEDESALSLLKRYWQDDNLIRLLWEPICISALNTPVDKSSAQVLLNVLRDSLNGSRSDSDMLFPRLDFSALFPDRAAEYVKQHGGTVMLSTTVDAIVPQHGRFELQTSNGSMTFDQVICAASPSSAARLFSQIPQLQTIARQIENIEYQPIYTVYLQYPAYITLPQPMLGLNHCISQWLFDRGRIAGQHGLIAVVISAEGRHQDLSQEQLADKVKQEIREQLQIEAPALWHQVIAEKRATFSCTPNLQRPSNITPIPNLLLAGDFTAGDYPATLEGAVMSGVQCSTVILNTGNSSPT